MNKILIFILGFVVGIILSKEGCKENTRHAKVDTISVKIDTLYVSHETIVEKNGKNILHDTTIYVELPKVIDTIEIIKDYFAQNVFSDTLHIDSLGYVAIIDTIKKNKIAFRKYHANIKERIIKETIVTRHKPRNSFYLGATIDQQFKPEITALITLQNRSAFTLGYSANGVRLGYYYKISFK